MYMSVRACMLAKAYKYVQVRTWKNHFRNFQSTYYSQDCGHIHKWVLVLFRSCWKLLYPSNLNLRSLLEGLAGPACAVHGFVACTRFQIPVTIASLPEKVVLRNAGISFNTWAVSFGSSKIFIARLWTANPEANVNKGCDCDLYTVLVAF